MSDSRFPGSRVTVKQVAEAAGVATSSVSRVFARHRMGEAAAGLMLTMLRDEGSVLDPVSVPTVYLPGQVVAPVPGPVTTLDDPREGGNPQ